MPIIMRTLHSVSNLDMMMQKPGVEGFFSAKDVPGGNDMGAVVHDEECFASEEVTCVGQPIGVVVADTEQHARMAARLVKVEYEDLPALISIEDAIEAASYYQVMHACLWSTCFQSLSLFLFSISTAVHISHRILSSRFDMRGQYHQCLLTTLLTVGTSVHRPA